MAPAAFATVNHGDFIGTGVDFKQVSETTNTAGDPEPIWEAPTLAGTGDQLVFAPSSFISSCNAGASDTTESVLTTTIEAQAGVHIELIALQENGDGTLTKFPPFGDPTTNISAAMAGTVTVTEDTSGPIVPVVIPFSGTFTPSSSFSLPGNFGTNNWQGNISVDVAAQVPNATKVDLSLTNTLAANCGAGNTAATIQKKDVTGPAVALMVNPLECELDLDKTCCVTQPVLPDLDACADNDDIVELTMEYTGDKCHNSTNDQGRSFRCWGRRKVGEPASITILKHSSEISATPSSGINIGDEVVFSSSTGTLFDKLKLKVTGPWWRRQYLKIDTSCDRAIQCGDKFGAFTVTGIETSVNGVVDCNAPPPPPECAPNGDPAGTQCDAKIVDMVLEYNGQDCQDPLGNPQNGEAECDGDATGATNVGVIYTGKFGYKQTITPASGINDGDRIRVTSTWWGGLFPNQSYKIVDGGGIRQTIDFHTSCSQPLALGDEFGSLKLVEFTTKSGFSAALGAGGPGPFDACEVPLAPPGPHCTSNLTEVTLVYIGDFLGEGCTVSNPQWVFGMCDGVDDPGDPVSITTAQGWSADPTDLIEFGDLVTFTATGGGHCPSDFRVWATGSGGTQDIRFKTSCWKPLSLGDRFGAWVVFGMDREDDGPITLGGNVQYQYKVTNPSTTETIGNVSIDDDQLGNIVSGETLLPLEMKTFVQNATLYGTTTNVATATGDVNGDVCDPGVDTVNIDVLAPPPGSFYCSEPISAITMVWDGTQTVDVRAWSGDPLASSVLNEFDDVAPGDAVEVTGLGQSYPTFEIFDSTGVTKLGESKFDLWCNDKSMNGVEDCGKRNGDLKWNDPTLINDWLFEGMVDSDETLECTPGLVPNPPSCGFGPELIVLMPGLMWWHRRRLRKEA
ncbi:MAG: DUF7467 domain-containing protein [Myxococcota bacterium]